MRKKLIRMITIFLAMCCFPTSVNAASGEIYVEVIKNSAPIRATPYEEGEVLARVGKDAIILVNGMKTNRRFHQWYEVTVNGKPGYIYSGNVEKHKHDYHSFTVNGITFSVCNCGHNTVTASNSYKQEEGNEILNSVAMALPMMAANYGTIVETASYTATAAAPLTLVDGPLPIADVLVGVTSILVVAAAIDAATPTLQEMLDMVTEDDFLKEMKKNQNICSEDSYYLVTKFPGGLKFVDRDMCMEVCEAFIASYYLDMDVWTMNETAALNLALIGSSVAGIEVSFERDAPTSKPKLDGTVKEKNTETYFFHYHYGSKKNGTRKDAHIFFGVNDLGATPI